MGAGMLGYLFGSFIAAGVLPGAFILYGATRGRSWATVVGFVVLALVLAGAAGSSSLNLGHALGAALSVGLAFVKKRP